MDELPHVNNSPDGLTFRWQCPCGCWNLNQRLICVDCGRVITLEEMKLFAEGSAVAFRRESTWHCDDPRPLVQLVVLLLMGLMFGLIAVPTVGWKLGIGVFTFVFVAFLFEMSWEQIKRDR